MNERVIFDAALEIDDLSARRAFIEKSCAGDEPLRTAVEALLSSHEAAGSFLNVPVAELMRGEPMKSDSTQDDEPQGSSDFNSFGRPNDPSDKTHVYESGTHKVDDADDESAPDLSFLEPSSKPGSIGVLGHYEVLKVLGQGGFGTVLKAFDEKLHRHVAIKVMSVQMAATSPPRKRFLREARAAAAIRHENIVQVYSVEEQPLPYLVMEFIDGPTLQQKQAGHGPLEIPEWLHIGRQLAAGLAAAHATGLIHRDIKPGNVLIEEIDGRGLRVEGQTNPAFDSQPLARPQPSTFNPQLRVKITDFGLARAADDASLSRSGTISGTPMYMAPEQALGQTLDHRADLFSLGSVLYELATGRPPFRAANTVAVLRRVVDDTPRPMQEIIPELPDWLVAIVNKLLAKNPAERFQSAKEVADLLGRCLLELQLSGQVTCVNVAESLRDSKLESRSDSATYAKTLDYKSPRLRDDSDESHGKRELRSSDSERSGGSSSTKPPQAKRSVLKVALIAMAFAVLSVFPLARLMKPAIDAWMWPPIPMLAESDVPGGLRFDGKDDYIEVGPFDWAFPQFTMEAFVTSDESSDNGTIALLTSLGDAQKLEWMSLYDGNSAAPGQRLSGAAIRGTIEYATAYGPFGGGVRQHRASVFDGYHLHYYINGIWQGKRRASAHTGMVWQMKQFRLGCDGGERRFFQGKIDQVRISKVARYSNNFAPVTSVTSDDSTLALYNFDEGHGDVLNDSSGHGHHGKIIGATWADRSRSRKTSAEPGEDGRSLTTSATASKFPPLAPGWFERVSKLPPEEQVQEVAAELKRRNPEWDEKLEHHIQDGYVLNVRFDSTQVADIAPLTALTDLHVLFCAASKPSDRLTELSPLAGLKQLHAVYFNNCTGLSDLSALRDLRITDCSLDNTSVTDLTPLAGMPILYLELSRNSQLTDLSPLKGAPLSSAFSCQRTGIRDLSPLRDSQVKQVVLHDYQFDPDIVCGWPLKSINFNGTMLSVPREKLLRLKEVKTLETIDGKPVAEFWKEFDN